MVNDEEDKDGRAQTINVQLEWVGSEQSWLVARRRKSRIWNERKRRSRQGDDASIKRPTESAFKASFFCDRRHRSLGSRVSNCPACHEAVADAPGRRYRDVYTLQRGMRDSHCLEKMSSCSSTIPAGVADAREPGTKEQVSRPENNSALFKTRSFRDSKVHDRIKGESRIAKQIEPSLFDDRFAPVASFLGRSLDKTLRTESSVESSVSHRVHKVHGVSI